MRVGGKKKFPRSYLARSTCSPEQNYNSTNRKAGNIPSSHRSVKVALSSCSTVVSYAPYSLLFIKFPQFSYLTKPIFLQCIEFLIPIFHSFTKRDNPNLKTPRNASSLLRRCATKKKKKTCQRNPKPNSRRDQGTHGVPTAIC